ncbi:gamma-glutamylcyclotransferase family protein [Streptomyces sp. NPDC059258]|uniref:gamma-glutamylcyclotransferase family protein n=1 Tax=unclassified Streptomyces TaxID=2593676 RepID=UPI00368305AE
MTHDAAAQPPPALAPTTGRVRIPPGGGALFVYGSLQFDAVLTALIGRVPRQTAAEAPGWRAARLTGRVYPGLVAAPGSVARGRLLTDLSGAEWRLLDAFEDDHYDLLHLPLAAGEGGLAYVWPGAGACPENWDGELFRERHLTAYAERCARLAPGLAARSLE